VHNISVDVKGSTTATISPNNKYYVAEWSSFSTPTKFYLYSTDGKRISSLEENVIKAMSEYLIVSPDNLSWVAVPTTDDVSLNGYIIKPAHFDANKKYPVLVFGYSGPANQVAQDKWVKTRNLFHNMIASMGCVVFCCDHRGSGGFGRHFKHAAYGDISKWMVHDQGKAVEYLHTLSYIDKTRIGFWGWSGGGYMALHLLARHPSFYSCAVAVAPVTDLKLYDTIWTERYMGLLSENKAGYDAANACTYAGGIRGGNLLIVHGTGDDNVHAQNTFQYVDALIAANKQFDQMIYPNRNHGIYGGTTQQHLFTLITNFFAQHLKLEAQ